MRTTGWRRVGAAAVVAAVMGGAGFMKTARADAPTAAAPKPPEVSIPLPTAPPPGAVLLITGQPAQLQENWLERYTKNPGGWTMTDQGVAVPDGHDIVSKQDFGDCYVHAEFWEPVDANGKAVGDGNSGVGLQGRYEIQILNSYGHQPEEHECGALYSEKAPRVIASKPAGQWQTFDIIFRAPRLDAAGKVLENPRATVFQNGILVQNNQEFTGPTGIQYGELHGMPKTGPLILQGDHNPVRFRNVWVAPIS